MANKYIFTILLLALCVLTVGSISNGSKQTVVTKTVVVTTAISHAELKHYLKQVNVKFPNIVYAQAVLETGNFTSNVFIDNNNLFGMRMSSNRPTTALYANNNYAVYKSWQESVLDYALYQAYYFDAIQTEEDYYKALKNYAEDSLYIKKISNIAKQF